MKKSGQPKTERSKMVKRYLAAAVCAALVGLPAAQGAGYDFESLPNNIILDQDDGWLSDSFGGEIGIRQDDTLANGTQVAQPLAGIDSGWPSYLTRVNDAAFGYSPFFGTETQAVLEFDTTAEAMSGFALGHDLNGNGLLDPETGEVGPVFGTLRDQTQGEEQFALLAADQQTLHTVEINGGGRCCNEDSDWYRLQLRMDLTANGGSGSGSLYYMNLTRGDTRFQPVVELQDLDLGLDAMDPDAGPETWNAMWLTMRFEGSQSMPRADNLVPRAPAVLAPDLTLMLQAVDAQPVLGARFDVELTPMPMAEDPGGFYWRLGQYAVADHGPESAATLLPNLDLVLEAVDIQAAFPELGKLNNVCLRYQDSGGADMIWRYDPSSDCQ